MSDHPPPDVRLLGPEHVDALVRLRREALESEPLSFGSSPSDDRKRSVEFLSRVLADPEGNAVFGGFRDGEMRGMVGLVRGDQQKQLHRALIWGMYVAAECRSLGISRALLGAAIDHARRWPGVLQLHLGVTTAAPAARKLYESMGFVAWGEEPRALCVDGAFVSEVHLVLALDAIGAPSARRSGA